MNAQPSLVIFAVFVGITLVVTYAAAGQSTTSRGFYTADRRISAVQNGWAIAGDYLSAASFLGITGLVAFYGFDGFMYSVGWLVAYLAVLFLVAEPLRNTGKYTMADTISFRLRGRGVRAIAAMSTLAVTLFYMIAQMVGSGLLFTLLLPQFSGLRRHRGRRRLDARLRAFRRNACHHVGADHQGIALARDRRRAFAAGHRTLSFLAGGVSASGRLGARLRQRNEPAAAGPALPRAPGRVESHFARDRARFRHGGPSAHPHAVLYGAFGARGARFDGVGDGARRDFLPHDVVHGARGGYDRRARAHRQTALCGRGHHLHRAASRTSAGPRLAARRATASWFLRRTPISRRPCSRDISEDRCSPPSSPPSPLPRFSPSSPASRSPRRRRSHTTSGSVSCATARATNANRSSSLARRRSPSAPSRSFSPSHCADTTLHSWSDWRSRSRRARTSRCSCSRSRGAAFRAAARLRAC